MTMQKIEMGKDFDTWGFVTLENGKITITGTDDLGKNCIESLLESMNRRGWTDTELFLSLPRRLNDRVWASKIMDENGQEIQGKNPDGSPASHGLLPKDFFGGKRVGKDQG